jgi:transcriptional regulator with XRE-family HTH domain
LSLKNIRKKRGYSQEELSQKVGISRQTLSSYETGSEISIKNAKKLAEVLDIDYACLIENKEPEEFEYNVIPNTDDPEQTKEYRIDIPEENMKKFREVLIYILEKVGAKPNVGQTVLYKLLYFIDFDYYELFEEQLIGAKYIKNTYGPTPIDFKKIIENMSDSGDIEVVGSKYFNREQTKYLPKRGADLSCLSACELKHIDRILEKLSDKTATQLSDFSHKDVPWIATKDKEIISYEAVFYRTPETSVRNYDL